MQQEEKQHQRSEINFMFVRIQKHHKLQVSQINDDVLESQTVGERPPGSSSQAALLQEQINF